MLEKLFLRNFQKHEAFDLELSPAINVICGASDQGKSSILRALRWLCTGQAPRSAMATWGSDEVAVSLTVDGKVIERRKSKSENTYSIDGKVFAAVGQGNVPEEVAKLLNIDQQNFQTQHAAHYWLSDTPGEVSRQLNSIVNLGLIDDSLAAVASEVKQAKQVEALVRQRLEAATARKDELKWAEQAEADLTHLEQLYSSIEQKRLEAATIARLIETASKADEAAKSVLKATAAKETALQKLQAIAERHAELSTSIVLPGSRFVILPASTNVQ